MKFYTVTDDYINFLKAIDNKVIDNTKIEGGRYRPFVGIVLEINSIKYLAPLTSYKRLVKIN